MRNTLVNVLLLMGFALSAGSGLDFDNLAKYGLESKKNIYTHPELLYSDYMYGDCTANNTQLYAHKKIDHENMKTKVILRGWLDIFHLPSCIVLRGTSTEEENYKATAFNFQICVARLKIIYNQTAFLYYYYEWFVPIEIVGIMDWDLYFYGPDAKDWGTYG